jgi:hypothetical protein
MKRGETQVGILPMHAYQQSGEIIKDTILFVDCKSFTIRTETWMTPARV